MQWTAPKLQNEIWTEGGTVRSCSGQFAGGSQLRLYHAWVGKRERVCEYVLWPPCLYNISVWSWPTGSQIIRHRKTQKTSRKFCFCKKSGSRYCQPGASLIRRSHWAERLFNDLDAYDKVSPYQILATEASPRSFRTGHKESWRHSCSSTFPNMQALYLLSWSYHRALGYLRQLEIRIGKYVNTLNMSRSYFWKHHHWFSIRTWKAHLRCFHASSRHLRARQLWCQYHSSMFLHCTEYADIQVI